MKVNKRKTFSNSFESIKSKLNQLLLTNLICVYQIKKTQYFEQKIIRSTNFSEYFGTYFGSAKISLLFLIFRISCIVLNMTLTSIFNVYCLWYINIGSVCVQISEIKKINLKLTFEKI
jgi:hypothetical protein